MLSFILSRRDLRENDQIISLYTLEKGKMEALARGVKKIISKNSAYSEPFFLVEAEIVPGKEISHITKVQPINIYKNIRSDLRKSLMAGYIMNLLEKFLQNGEKDAWIFDLIKNWLEFLDAHEVKNNAPLFSFMIKFLNLLGFKPELEKCVACGAKEIVGFYFAGGGAVCKNCAVKKLAEMKDVAPLGKNDWRDLVAFLSDNWDKIGAENVKVFKIIHRFAQYHSERKLAYFSQI